MVLGHEKLDVYRLSIAQVAWVYEKCAAIQDILVVGLGLDKAESRQRKGELDRIASMLIRLDGRGYTVKEGFGEYGYTEFDPDTDPDSDFDKIQIEQ